MATGVRSMYQVAGLLLSASAVRYAGQVVMLIFIARFLGVGAVGSYTVALAICAPVYILAGFGMRTVYLTLQTDVATRTYERFLLAALGAALGAIGIISVFLSPEIARVLLVVAVIRTGETYVDLYAAMLQRAGRSGTIVTVTAAGTVLQVVATAAVFSAGGSLVQALLASCVVYTLNLLAFTRRVAVTAARGNGHAGPTAAGAWTHLFRAGLPTGVAIGMITLLSTVPQYLLALGGHVADAGRFAVFLYVVVAVEVLLHALAQSWIPRARELFAAGELTIGAIGAMCLRWMLVTSSLGLAGLTVAALILPAVLGPDFVITFQLALPLAAAVILVPGVFAADTAIVVHNRYALSLTVSICALAIGLVAGFTLVALGAFDLTAALWTFSGTMAVRALGGFAAVLLLPQRSTGALDLTLVARWWPLLPVFAAAVATVAAGPAWTLGAIASLLILGLLCALRMAAPELLVVTAPLAFYVTAGGVLINLAVSDLFLVLLLVRVLTDPNCTQAFRDVTDNVRAALYILAFLLVVTSSTTLLRYALGAEADWIAYAADAMKLSVVIAYFIVCLVIFRHEFSRGETRFLRIWAVTAAAVGALGVIGAVLFAAGTQTSLTMDFRATGTFEDPNAFATYLIMSLPITLAARLLAGRSILSWHLIPILAGIYASFSRGALVGLAAVLVVLFLASLRDPVLRSLRIIAFLTVVVAVVFVADGSAGNLFESSRGVSFGEDVRFRLWAAAGEVWLHSPIFGVGLGQFITASAGLLGSAGGVLAHNTYLSILAEGGVVGTALYLAVPTMAVIGLLRRRSTVSMLLLTSGVGIAAMALSLNLQNFRPIWIFLAIALAWATQPRPPSGAVPTPQSHLPTRHPQALRPYSSDSRMDEPWN